MNHQKNKKLLLPAFLMIALVVLVLLPGKESIPNRPLAKKIVVPTEEGKERQRDRPDQAFDQEFEMTKDRKLGYIPTNRLVEAHDSIKESLKRSVWLRSAIDGVKWIERGPNNVGGRTRALMFDPNDPTAKKIWAGAIGGGLWYNNDITNEASSWLQDKEIMTNVAISALTFDPTNTQIFYLGTGLGYTDRIRGAGMWKSTDAGNSWSHIASTGVPDFEYIQKIKVTNQGTVIASTLTDLFRSTNSGETWNSVLSGRFGDIEIASDGTIYSTKGAKSEGAIYKSTDDGLTWADITPVTGGLRTELALAPSDANIIYAIADGGPGNIDIRYFKKSTDAGETWTDLAVPTYLNHTDPNCGQTTQHFTRGQAFFDLILAVHPENPDVVFAGGIDIHRSTNGGRTWNNITQWTGSCDDFAHSDHHEFIFRPGYPNTFVSGNDGGIDYSPDAGNAPDPEFQRRVKDFNTVLLYSSASVNEIGSNQFLAGSQDNGTQQFTKHGMNAGNEVTPGDGAMCFIDPNNPDIQISSFVRNTYQLSTNRGLSFHTSLSNDQVNGRFINPADMDFSTGILYSAVENDELGRIFNIPSDPSGSLSKVTLDLGGNQISTVKVSPHTSNRVFVGVSSDEGGRIYQIDNAHTDTPTVTDITGDMDDGRGSYLRSIDIGASDDQLLITFSNYGANSVYTSNNGGDTWLNKEDNLPDIAVRWALFNPNERKQVLLATDLGVWTTNDITATNPGWETSNNGLNSVRVDHLRYRPADETIFAATYGRGLFTSNVFATTVKADFKTDQIVGYVGVPVNFEDASLLPDEQWNWDFGDGGTSSLQNPAHTYQQPGTYDVSLSIASGIDSETKTAYVTILPTLPTPYLAADGGDFESNFDHFTSKSLLNDTDPWERGIPGNSLTQVSSGTNAWKTKLNEDLGNPGFRYQAALYTPAFDLSDINKDYTASFKLSMETAFCNLPVALKVEYSVDGGQDWYILGNSNNEFGDVNWYNRGPNLACRVDGLLFEDQLGWTQTLNGPTTDVDILTQTKLNFLAGESNVSLRFVLGVAVGLIANDIAPSSYNVDGFMIDDFEILTGPPLAHFSADQTVLFENTSVQFNPYSDGGDTYLWDFGDNTTSTEKYPTHDYSNPGSYDVTLTVTTNGQQTVDTKTDYIKVIPTRDVSYALSDGGNFEVNTGDFTPINTSGTGFELGSSNVSGKDGTASGSSAWVTGIDADRYENNSKASLVSPLFRFSESNKVYTLEFKAKFRFESTWDGFIVNYTTDKGRNWRKLNNNVEPGWYNLLSNTANIPFDGEGAIFSGNTGGEFLTFSTDVTFLTSEEVAFEILFLSDENVQNIGLAIDDFQVLVSEPEPLVADFSIQTGNGCSGQQVVYTSTSTGRVETYQWNFGANAEPSTATGSGPHTVTYSTTGVSTPSLTITDIFEQSSTETKTDAVTTNASHSPSFTEEDNGDKDIARLVASDGDAYQWYFNGNAIPNASSQILLATERGDYAVDVTVNGCTVRTQGQNVITSTEINHAFQASISVFPNPVQDFMNVKVSNANMGQMKIVFHSLSGAKVIEKNVQKSTFDAEYRFDLSTVENGVYILEIQSKNGRGVKRVLKR